MGSYAELFVWALQGLALLATLGGLALAALSERRVEQLRRVFLWLGYGLAVIEPLLRALVTQRHRPSPRPRRPPSVFISEAEWERIRPRRSAPKADHYDDDIEGPEPVPLVPEPVPAPKSAPKAEELTESPPPTAPVAASSSAVAAVADSLDWPTELTQEAVLAFFARVPHPEPTEARPWRYSANAIYARLGVGMQRAAVLALIAQARAGRAEGPAQGAQAGGDDPRYPREDGRDPNKIDVKSGSVTLATWQRDPLTGQIL